MSRIAKVVKDGLEYEVDQRQAEILMKDRGTDGESRGLTAPGSSSEGGHGVGGK